MFKYLLVGLVVFGTGTVIPVQAQTTATERALIAQENMIVSAYAVKLAKLSEYVMAQDPDTYIAEASNLVKSWDSLTPTLGAGKGLEYMHKAISAHRSILRLSAISALAPEHFVALYNEANDNLQKYLDTPLPDY